jgi:DNA-binding NtrC family response regulator
VPGSGAFLACGVRGLAARFNTKFRKDLFDISAPALEALETFPWPGNIRQMENFMQQAVLVSSGPDLLLEHLPQPVRDYQPAPRPVAVPDPAAMTRIAATLPEIRDEKLRHALARLGAAMERE